MSDFKFNHTNCLIQFATVGIFFLLIQLDVTGGMVCKGMDNADWEQDRTWRMECMKEQNTSTTDSKQFQASLNSPCFRKCLVIKRGIVSESGEPNNENAIEFGRQITQKEVHPELSKQFTECVSIHGSKVKELNKSCESYAAVSTCMQSQLEEVCGSKFRPK